MLTNGQILQQQHMWEILWGFSSKRNGEGGLVERIDQFGACVRLCECASVCVCILTSSACGSDKPSVCVSKRKGVWVRGCVLERDESMSVSYTFFIRVQSPVKSGGWGDHRPMLMKTTMGGFVKWGPKPAEEDKSSDVLIIFGRFEVVKRVPTFIFGPFLSCQNGSWGSSNLGDF